MKDYLALFFCQKVTEPPLRAASDGEGVSRIPATLAQQLGDLVCEQSGPDTMILRNEILAACNAPHRDYWTLISKRSAWLPVQDVGP